ncbi:MAG: D-2-hydroxyacid dehydrogenase family protein [Pseudomonadota bacterium]|nr:D-2-hydroxyacid dehydrogenase family protein [Pseudomonadota bacterium]
MARVAVLDDWQGVARSSADWSKLEARAELTFFADAFADEADAAQKLAPFEIVLAMRERTHFTGSLLRSLPRLKMLGTTGGRTLSLDMATATALGIVVCNTGSGPGSAATAELALGLMLAAFRAIPEGDAAMRAGGFQHGVPVGSVLEGKTLGILGLGRIGAHLARYGQALGMSVLAWSQNLTAEKARAEGATFVAKDELLARSDAITLHLVLSDRTRGVIGRTEIARMKLGAVLVNTSRGPLVDEAALLEAVRAGHIVAAVDVYDREPLPADHPLRGAPNTVLTPHLGYGVREVWEQFYPESVENALAFLDGKPVRVANPETLQAS